ncbi:hypothetical protein TcasGA2_TC032369 [Tribolium castaneum]|uniref:Ig-like domain-containing protein n=1 Tax=Tribolium castaneum TaxID=7070 RepID=A0A139WLB1_TRICA|nr:PREDICTED: uncharacterized protein LOC103312311 [Tribolium castaneum]XP_015833346.1 PREDICTED: uncharacterized protein LOC103312311 [Tribolium castaneum]KYB28621.1 hypothetical protein TcasGA2_TC032369 [Tribolium castaneum]|eukprot:XP_015833345.1 PREDICTED: uncharacterized protein LOC103312311 [Tribolium castaneum]
MAKIKAFLVCFFGLWFTNSIVALEITSLDVPKSAWDPVKLNCKYDLLEDETLYGVKWYKDQSEFFRCFANGTVQEFPRDDIKIYHMGRSQTGSCFFELIAISPESGGEYKCEVSLEWPTFQTVSQTAKLNIIEPSRIVQSEGDITEDVVSLSVEKSRGSRWLPSPLIILFYIIYTC